MSRVYRPARWLHENFWSWLRGWRDPARLPSARQVRPFLERLEEVLPANALYSPFAALLPAAAAAYSVVNNSVLSPVQPAPARELPPPYAFAAL